MNDYLEMIRVNSEGRKTNKLSTVKKQNKLDEIGFMLRFMALYKYGINFYFKTSTELYRQFTKLKLKFGDKNRKLH